MVACNGFAATGGTAVVDDAAVAEFVVAVFGVELILAILAEQQLE